MVAEKKDRRKFASAGPVCSCLWDLEVQLQPELHHAVGAAIRADVIGGAESESDPVGIGRGALRRYRGRRVDDGVVRQGRGDGRSALQRGSGIDAAPWRLIEGVEPSRRNWR